MSSRGAGFPLHSVQGHREGPRRPDKTRPNQTRYPHHKANNQRRIGVQSVTMVTEQRSEEIRKNKSCAGGCSVWCRKYFWEGQQLTNSHAQKLETAEQQREGLPMHKRFLLRQRRLIGLLTPALFVHFFWWGLVIDRNLWNLFKDKYFMTITMIFGSMVAGLTSEGGGAVAFPVMTLGFGINPSVARDFSMMIQSVGMSSATLTLLIMKVQLEWHSIILCSLGGMGGMIFGLHMIDPLLSPPQKKMFFVSIWFAFASVLLFINRHHKRTTFDKIVDFNLWKGVVLIMTGFVGGIFTSFAGSGLDICSFSILTLLFRISEKVATPTSVVLMAGNSIIGFYWRGVMIQGIDTEAWEFLAVCVPVVVFGAPFGSVIGTHFHRLVLAALVILIDLVALIGAFAIVKLTPTLIGVSVGIIVGGFLFFWFLGYLGRRLVRNYEKKNPDVQQLVDGVENPAMDNGEAAIEAINHSHSQVASQTEKEAAFKATINPPVYQETPNGFSQAIASPPTTVSSSDGIDFITIRGEMYAIVKPIVVTGNSSSVSSAAAQQPRSMPEPSLPKEKHVIKVGYSGEVNELDTDEAKSSAAGTISQL